MVMILLFWVGVVIVVGSWTVLVEAWTAIVGVGVSMDVVISVYVDRSEKLVGMCLKIGCLRMKIKERD